MKNIVSFFSLITVGVGLAFYLYHSPCLSQKNLPTTLRLVPKNGTETALTEPQRPQMSEVAAPTTGAKKGCACCRSAREKVKQRRGALEMWARKMIDTHGYEEGMKRVRAKSPILARRIQDILEKEKKVAIPRQTVQ
ncbi:hypothetical protein F4X10_13095 [Candidatus Poribacteria bacterium]|nr:hypothetical protein [Candidatus Poribacteria bacterium]